MESFEALVSIFRIPHILAKDCRAKEQRIGFPNQEFKNFSCPRSFHAVFGGKLRYVAGTKLSHLCLKLEALSAQLIWHIRCQRIQCWNSSATSRLCFSRTFSECSSSIDLVKYGGFFWMVVGSLSPQNRDISDAISNVSS